MQNLRAFEIIEYLKTKKYCSMNELMEKFNISPATAQRDVSSLVKKKLVQKVHGGVAYIEKASLLTPVEPQADSHFSKRIKKNQEKKKQIAAIAFEYIKDGDIIFLDSSTTAFYLARELQSANFSHLTIVTNSVLIIQEFYKFPTHFILLALGGNFNPQLNSFLGKTAIENLLKLNIDKAFISAMGTKDEKVYTYHESHAEFLKTILNTSCQKFLLLDSTKFDKVGLFDIGSTKSFDYILSI